jgi:hypothetical protein
MQAEIVERPTHFDRVDLVKEAAGQEVLPGDDALWILGEDLVVEVDGERIVVPAGFTTDGASVPGWAQWLTGWGPWEEPQRWAAIVHDWLYHQEGTSKWYSDQVFRALLEAEGASAFKSTVMFLAVTIGAWHAYSTDQATPPGIWV